MSDSYITPELRQKITDALWNIRNLVGDANFTLEEKKRMKQEFARIWNEYERTGRQTFKNEFDYSLVAVLIVTIAKDDRGDWHGGDFWGRVNQALGEFTATEVKLNSDYSIVGKIADALVVKTGNKSGRVLFRGAKRYVQTFLFQSYAPSQSIDAYVKLLWSLFASELFDYEYIDQTDRDLCYRIVENLARLYSNGLDLEDDIVFNGRTYQIREGLRRAFVQDKVSSALLTRRILDYLNRAFRLNEDISLETDGDYLASIVNDNLKTILTPAIRKMPKRERKLLPVNDIKAIHASYFLEQDEQGPRIHICVNGSRLGDEFRGSRWVKLNVYRLLEDGRIQGRLCVTGEILSSDFIPTFEELSVDITKFFEVPIGGIRIQAVLEVDDEVIYDSLKAGDDLDRSFLIFKGNKEVRGNCKPDYYTLVSTAAFKPEDSLHIENGYGRVGGSRIAYEFTASDGDRITSSFQSVFFGFKRKDEHYYWEAGVDPFPGVRVKSSEGLFTVYRSLSPFHIHVEEESDFDNLWIEDSGKEERKQFFPRDMAFKGNHIELPTETFPCFEPRTLRVLKKQPGREKPDVIYEEKYFIDPAVSIETRGICSYQGGSFSIKWRLNKLEGTYHFLHQGITTEEKERQWGEYNQDEHLLEVPFGDYSAIIDVPYFRWSFDDQTYNSIPREKKIWVGDIHSGQIINIDSSFEMEGVFLGQKKLLPGRAKNSFLLGDAVISGRGMRASQTVFGKTVVDEHEVSFRICQIATQPELTVNPLNTIDITEDGQPRVFLSDGFIGPEDAEFEYEFTDVITEETFKVSGKFCLEDSNALNQALPDGEYAMTLSCRYRDPVSLKSDYKVLYSSVNEDDTIIIGDPDKFLYRGVSRLVFAKTRDGNGKWIKFNGSDFIDHIEYLKAGESHPFYKGIYHAPKSKGVPVVFNAIEQDTIKMHFIRTDSDGEEMICYSIDNSQRRLVAEKADNHNLFRCLTIYCDIEED